MTDCPRTRRYSDAPFRSAITEALQRALHLAWLPNQLGPKGAGAPPTLVPSAVTVTGGNSKPTSTLRPMKFAARLFNNGPSGMSIDLSQKRIPASPVATNSQTLELAALASELTLLKQRHAAELAVLHATLLEARSQKPSVLAVEASSATAILSGTHTSRSFDVTLISWFSLTIMFLLNSHLFSSDMLCKILRQPVVVAIYASQPIAAK